MPPAAGLRRTRSEDEPDPDAIDNSRDDRRRGSAAQAVQVDATHVVLILEFTSAEDADRVASEIGGPWMREHIIPLLARGPERSVGEVIASATATG